jgi:NTP pyrophosphatase (non-canonical NTP hydrolase)
VSTPTQSARECFAFYAGADAPNVPLEHMAATQVLLARWQARNFGGGTAEQLALGVCEEAGELAHAVLKASQGIRGQQDPEAHREAVGDAIADCAIYLAQMATLYRLDFAVLFEATAHEVMKRDWKRSPGDGK